MLARWLPASQYRLDPAISRRDIGQDRRDELPVGKLTRSLNGCIFLSRTGCFPRPGVGLPIRYLLAAALFLIPSPMSEFLKAGVYLAKRKTLDRVVVVAPSRN